MTAETDPFVHALERDDAHEAPRIPRLDPIFIAGPDRSGTTLMYSLLASHPEISMVRRTNLWRYFYERYGDLSEPENFERCLDEMLRFRRMRHLHPDEDRIRREFASGEATYGRLFALFHGHNAERNGRTRWGDKSLHTELFAEGIFREYPEGRVIHMIRDPRDRYASVSRRNDRNLDRVGAATGRWLLSARAGRRNAAAYPDRYLCVHFEDLVADPSDVMEQVCQFVGVDFVPSMMDMGAEPELRRSGGNSSFGDGAPGGISRKPVGRYRSVLDPSDVAFIEQVAGREMERHGYELHGSEGLRRGPYILRTLPEHLARMIGWIIQLRVNIWRGIRVPDDKLDDLDAGGGGEVDD